MKIPLLDIVIEDDKFHTIHVVLMLSSVIYLISQANKNSRTLQYMLYKDMGMMQQRMMVDNPMTPHM